MGRWCRQTEGIRKRERREKIIRDVKKDESREKGKSKRCLKGRGADGEGRKEGSEDVEREKKKE